MKPRGPTVCLVRPAERLGGKTLLMMRGGGGVVLHVSQAPPLENLQLPPCDSERLSKSPKDAQQ